MKTFSFSLQRLLETKKALEETVEMRLAAAMRDVVKAQKKLKEFKGKIRKEVKRVEALKGSKTSCRELLTHQKYLDDLDGRKEKWAEHIACCEEVRDEIRTILVGVVKERKALDSLKSREKEEWVLQNRREDLREMDEIATTRFMRQKHAV